VTVTPPIARRTRFALEYAAAPRQRFNLQTIAVGAGAVVEITAQMPTQAQCGRAPYFDLLVGFNSNDVNDGLLGVVVTDDPAVTAINYAYTEGAETDGIRVNGLFPRDATVVPTVLQTPLPGGPTNRVYLNNRGAAPRNVPIVCEIPTLDWV
jgi:hypothetical protein